jgi:RNA polymerase sigma-70 factor (ECF subfamily)
MGQQRSVLTRGYKNYSKEMHRYAVSKTSNQALADDLVQQTFVKTWSYLERGGEIVTMKPFLYHVLRALVIDEYRKQKNISLDTLLEKGFEPPVYDNDRQVDIADGAQLMALIAELPVRYRTILWLRYKQERSIKEIADITGQTTNTVTVQTFRGIEKLKVLHGAHVAACERNR